MNGLDDLAAEILESAGLNESDIENLPIFGASSLKPPPVVTPTTDLNSPSISTSENFFDRALVNGRLENGPDGPYTNGVNDSGMTASSALDAWAKAEEQGEVDPEEGGWDIDAGEASPQHDQFEEDAVAAEMDVGAGATPGISELELWVRNSPFAADHVAAGSFERAMQASGLI